MTAAIFAKTNGTQGALYLNSSEVFSYDATGMDSPFNLTANIVANRIDVTLAKGGWRFRNTTPANGTPTYVKTETDLTLTIASTDSFGLVTAAGNQRIAIIEFNDNGNLRLGATALAGGVQLDETNLLSATVTATTGTAILSGVVVTSRAYRVVGFVEATFTTAVGWGSLGTVQSVGGQALAAMSSLGYGQTWQDVTGSRAITTTYYNTTGKPIQVHIAPVISTSTNSAVVTVGAVTLISSAQTATNVSAITFIVPVGGSYSIAATNITSINSWRELR